MLAEPLSRPPVSVVMPFAGSRAEAEAAARTLATIDLRPGDELLLADNTDAGVAVGAATPTQVSVVSAVGERSSYHARNAGARHARNEWLLFLDADCRPHPGILDAYFEPAPEAGEGALAGEVGGAGDQGAPLARYSRSRGYLSQRSLLDDPFRPHAVTANLLVRRAAWASIGGFAEGVRSGGDSDFCWRLQEAGWSLGYRPEARAEHSHRTELRPFLRVATRYAAGRAWLRRRWPGAFAVRPGAGAALRSAAAAVRWTFAGELERGAFRAVDAAVGAADLIGEQLPNRPPSSATSARPQPADVAVIVDAFPVQSETFVVAELLALERLGHTVRIEAARRPLRQALGALGAAPVRYLEDDARLEKLTAGLWLGLRHPAGCWRDLRDRRRWAAEEPVLPLRAIAPALRRLSGAPEAKLYCHFAGAAALTTLRISRLTGRPYALTAHAYDIFRDVHNLREKLEGAEAVFTGCDYNVEHLRSLVGPGHRERIHEVVMGIDPEGLRRQRPRPGGRRVIAVGRLVEKKGFGDLIAAVAQLGELVDELVLVGDGPLRPVLEAQVQRLGARDRVRLTGAVEPSAVRDLLESADVLAMPCVIAPDGDRDSMPVVVKEALALELPVVATNQVGLPELVRPPWGRLVPPHDPAGLAGALAEVLALDRAERSAAGRAGRAHVIEHASVMVETAKLARWLGLERRGSLPPSSGPSGAAA